MKKTLCLLNLLFVSSITSAMYDNYGEISRSSALGKLDQQSKILVLRDSDQQRLKRIVVSHMRELNAPKEIINQFKVPKVINKEQVESCLFMVLPEKNLDEVKYLIETFNIDVNVKNVGGISPLMIASAKGFLSLVRYLIDRGADVNIKSKKGATSLIIASEAGHLEIVRHLVEYGVDVNDKDKDNLTALMMASFKGYLEIVRYLVEQGADINATLDSGWTSLMLASRSGHFDIVEYLSKNEKCDIKFRDEAGLTAFDIAKSCNHLEMADMLWQYMERSQGEVDLSKVYEFPELVRNVHYWRYLKIKNSDNDEIDNEWKTKGKELKETQDLEKKHVRIVSQIIDRSPNLIYVDLHDSGLKKLPKSLWNHARLSKIRINLDEGYRVPDYVYFPNNKAIVSLLTTYKNVLKLSKEERKSLIREGIYRQFVNKCQEFDIHKQLIYSVNGNKDFVYFKPSPLWSTLYVYILGYDTEGIKEFISAFPNIDIHDGLGDQALIYAVIQNNFDAVQYLINNGVNVDSVNDNEETPLILASENGYSDIVRYLIKQGADVNAVNADNSSSLMYASLNGYIDIMECLIRKGANIEIRTRRDMYYPLMFAAYGGNFSSVQCLVENGANIEARSRNNCTSLMVASEYGYLDIVRYLIEHGANVNAVNKDNCSSLIFASSNGHIDLVKYLVQKGADLEVRTKKDRYTALMVAVYNGYFDIVCYLVENGADVCGKDRNNCTPVMIASEYGYTNIAKYLMEQVNLIDQK